MANNNKGKPTVELMSPLSLIRKLFDLVGPNSPLSSLFPYSKNRHEKKSQVKLNSGESMSHRFVIKPPKFMKLIHEKGLHHSSPGVDNVEKEATVSRWVQLLSPWISHEQ